MYRRVSGQEHGDDDSPRRKLLTLQAVKLSVGAAACVAAGALLMLSSPLDVEFAASSCTFEAAVAGTHVKTCEAEDGKQVSFTVAVPSGCLDSRCGLVMDIHGRKGSADVEEHSDEVRSKGNARGLIVIQPSAPLDDGGNDPPATPMPSWSPANHHPVLLDFLRHAVDVFHVDTKRVHVMGYSQGGFASWRLLCMAPDLICSAAPLEASGLDLWRPGYGKNCFEEDGPAVKRSLLYTTGTTDHIAQVGLARRQDGLVRRAYGIAGQAMATVSGHGYRETVSSASGGVKYSYIEHDYNITGLGAKMRGHCFPTTRESHCTATFQSDGVEFSLRCCGDFTWSDKVLDFFEQNQCQ